MNVPDGRVETDWAEVGCSKRSCRYEHSYRWGLCAHAEEPPPDTRCFRWKTFTASDGYLSVGTEEVDHTELHTEIEREVRAKVAEEILSDSTPAPWTSERTAGDIRSWIDSRDAAKAARIARGES